MISISKNAKLKDILEKLNKPFVCNGRGTCGKCKIKVLSGSLPITEKEKKLFTPTELFQGYRLACQHVAPSDLTIEWVHDDNTALIEGWKEDLSIRNAYDIQSLNKNLFEEATDTVSFCELLESEYKITLPRTIRILNQIGNIHLYKNPKLITFNKVLVQITDNSTAYGIAIDIGTTTVVLCLVDLISGKVIAEHKTLNSQKKYGADVISRIVQSELSNPGVLQKDIISDLNSGITALLENNKINPVDVIKLVIAANNVMTHFLLGLATHCLGQIPYKPLYTESLTVDSKSLGIELLDCPIAIIGNFSGFVGGDIVSGLLTTDIDISENVIVFIDLGTNGELVIGNKNALIASSTATGPAFEGGNISCGIGSIAGAIHDITYDNNEFKYQTFGNLPPVGVCGSGLIALVAALIENKLIDKSGKILNPAKEIVIDEKYHITFNQKDVRELQLAKAAIRTGIDLIIATYGCTYQDVKKVYLSGGFGSHTDINHVTRIGMIPDELKDKIIISGNTSLNGAIRYLLSDESQRIEKLQQLTQTINLAELSEFKDVFMQNLYFPAR